MTKWCNVVFFKYKI